MPLNLFDICGLQLRGQYNVQLVLSVISKRTREFCYFDKDIQTDRQTDRERIDLISLNGRIHVMTYKSSINSTTAVSFLTVTLLHSTGPRAALPHSHLLRTLASRGVNTEKNPDQPFEIHILNLTSKSCFFVTTT